MRLQPEDGQQRAVGIGEFETLEVRRVHILSRSYALFADYMCPAILPHQVHVRCWQDRVLQGCLRACGTQPMHAHH